MILGLLVSLMISWWAGCSAALVELDRKTVSLSHRSARTSNRSVSERWVIMLSTSAAGVCQSGDSCSGLLAGVMGSISLHLGQVRRQVEREPSVPGPEALGLRGLGVPHDPEPVVERLEVHYPVVSDPELLLAAREVQVLGGVAQ